MDVARMMVTTGGVALIGATLWFFFGKRDRGGARGAEQHGEKPAAVAEKAYYCPMHPWITSADPTATCSLCGMKLVKDEDRTK